eukprot:jgi/Phyca11/104824/e_gw1.10.306.1
MIKLQAGGGSVPFVQRLTSLVLCGVNFVIVPELKHRRRHLENKVYNVRCVQISTLQERIDVNCAIRHYSDDEEGQFIDLPSSIQDRTPRYNEDDLENPYADLSQYDNSSNAPNEVADADLDYVEEISDNEQPSSFLSNPRPVSVREDLKEFENFISMEDLRRDYGCRINFNQMFAGQRSGKSYSDRLATRTAASRKRKRTAAQIESGELPASAARKGKKTKAKAAKGGKKRKSPAAGRRGTSSSRIETFCRSHPWFVCTSSVTLLW